MSCTSFSNHTLSFLQFQARNPKISSPHSFPFLVKSSDSQINGLRLPTLTTPSPHSTSFRTPICAKVSKGDVPPSFALKDQDGKPVSLSKFKGKPVVVYFYPADESPGCTKQEAFHEFIGQPF